MRNTLDRITLKGFKTIRSLENFKPGPLTVLIGPNGAGKSNLISFFRMMRAAMSANDGLPKYVAKQGARAALFHGGADPTYQIEAGLTIQTARSQHEYVLPLVPAAGDTLTYAEEQYSWPGANSNTTTQNWNNMGT